MEIRLELLYLFEVSPVGHGGSATQQNASYSQRDVVTLSPQGLSVGHSYRYCGDLCICGRQFGDGELRYAFSPLVGSLTTTRRFCLAAMPFRTLTSWPVMVLQSHSWWWTLRSPPRVIICPCHPQCFTKWCSRRSTDSSAVGVRGMWGGSGTRW